MMKSLVTALVTALILISTSNLIKSNHVLEKRSLLFPVGGSKVQLITGFGIPADLLGNQHLTVGTVFKASYRVPQNVSDLRPQYVTVARKKRSANRWDIYGLLARMIDIRGYSGRACILRTICEMAQTPLERNQDVFHELLHVLFTPTATLEDVESNQDNEYYAAQMLGKKGDNCERLFKECGFSLADLITAHYE